MSDSRSIGLYWHWTVKVIDIDRKCVLESASQHEHLAPGADMALHALYQKIQKYGT